MSQKRNQEIKYFAKLIVNSYTTSANLWNTLKSVLKGIFIALSAYIKNTQLKTLEQKEKITLQRSRCQEIFESRAEIDNIEQNKATQESMKQSSLESYRRISPYTKLIKTSGKNVQMKIIRSEREM